MFIKRSKMMWKKLTQIGLALSAFSLVGCYYFDSPDIEQYRPYFKKQSTPIEKGAVSVRFLGTTSLVISDGKTTLMTDGFLSRPGDKLQLLFGEIGVNKTLVYQYLERLDLLEPYSVDAIMVFHSHYDHAMDAPEIAWKTGAKVMGSQSTAFISQGYDLPEDQIVVVEHGKPYTFGDFTVRFLPSQHVKLPFPTSMMGMMEDIEGPLRQPASMFAYREGETYAIVVEHPKGSFLLHGGDYLKEDELKGIKVDTVFLCTPGIPALGDQRREAFFNEVVVKTGAKRVIPVHWDDFSKPLHEPLVPLPRIAEDLDQAMSFLFKKQKENPDLKIEFLPTWDKVQLFPDS